MKIVAGAKTWRWGFMGPMRREAGESQTRTWVGLHDPHVFQFFVGPQFPPSKFLISLVSEIS